MADKITNSENYKTHQTYDVDIQQVYNAYVKSDTNTANKDDDNRGIDDYRSKVAIKAASASAIAKAMQKNEHYSLFKAEDTYQESRCHAFYRMIGFPVYDIKTNNFYNPGFDNLFTGPYGIDRKLTKNVKREIAVNSINNKSLTDIFDERENIPTSFLKYFNANESINASIITLSGVNIREFVAPLKDIDITSPLFEYSGGLNPLSSLYTISTSGHVGKNRPDLYSYIGSDGTSPTLPTTSFNRKHIIFPFLTDARYTESLNMKNVLSVPFSSPSENPNRNNKVSETVVASSPLLESIITNRLSVTFPLPSEEITRIMEYVADFPNINDTTLIKEVFAGTNDSQQKQLEKFLYIMESMLVKLVQAQNTVDRAMELYYWIPIPSTTGPEYGVSSRAILISKELAKNSNLITELDLQIIKGTISKMVANNEVSSKEYAQVAQKKKVFPQAAIIFNPEVNDACGNNVTKSLDSLNANRTKILKEASEALQIIEMIMGEYSGLGLCDILSIIASLYIIPQEYLLGFLDDDAFVRMCYYLNLPGSSLKRVTLVEAQSKLVETVKEFYNLFDKIYLSMRDDANRSSQ